jgi:dTDP-4-dehydrorhamnose 3,5-epimerase
MDQLNGVQLTPLKRIEGEAGKVLHALKKTDDSFAGFGEAYFSTVLPGKTKGWKKHREMTLNVIVPVGAIRFVMYDDREDSATKGSVQEVILSPDNYQRLTVPPGIWMAFHGEGVTENMLLNMASIPHDPNEADNLPLINDYIPYPGFTS